METGINDLADAISDALAEYGAGVEAAAQRAVDVTAVQCDAEIRAHLTFKTRTGDYVKAFSLLRKKGRGSYRSTWHVKSPHYRRTHLLENGHATPDGGRTQPYPHIVYGARIAAQNLVPNLKKELEAK